ncbi:MAG: GNAT family N-acetyltransferase [Thermoguttaceae bacterium]
MPVNYFKRYRMELDLAGRDLTWPVVPSGYRLLAWDRSLLDRHAEAMYEGFRDTIDASVFPCFTELAGCQRLMAEIARKPGFLSEATWLAVRVDPSGQLQQPCGTVQGIRDHFGFGAIQNVAVTPPCRNQGLGTALVFRALCGFWQVGLRRVYLEVTADNHGAVRLYQRVGFRVIKTLFKTAELAYP